jgi:GAF domain-containing protein
MSAPATTRDELRDEVERLRLLQSISLEFSASLDFDQLLPTVFNRVVAALGAEGGSIWIADGELLRCRIAVGGRGDQMVGAQIPIGTGLVGDVAQQQKTTMVTREAEVPLNIMATAMVAGGVTVGAIQVTNKLTGDGMFDEHDRALLEGLAAMAAISLRNAQLHAAEKRAGDLALLFDISREITATLDLDRVLHSVVNLASRALPFDRAAVALYEKGKCEIRAVAGEERSTRRIPGCRISSREPSGRPDGARRSTWSSASPRDPTPSGCS